MKRAVLVLFLLLAGTRVAHAQKLCEFPVGPSGGAFEVLVHPLYVTDFDFKEKLSPSVVVSDLRGKDYTVDFKASGTGLSVHPENEKARPANFNAETSSGSIKVSVALSVATDHKQACTRVIFNKVTEAEAFRRRVDEQVQEETAKLRGELEDLKKDVDRQVRQGVDEYLADRVLLRHESVAMNAIGRSDDVVVRVGEVLYVGDDAFVFFQVENRSKLRYRFATAQLLAGRKDEANAVRLLATSRGVPEAGTMGSIPVGTIAQGVVVVRQVGRLRGQSLALVASEPDGKRQVRVDGIVLR